jgi:hypothetical protein
MNSRIAAGMANAVEAMVARNTPSSMQHLVCWPPLLENGSVLLEGVVLLATTTATTVTKLTAETFDATAQVRRLECLLQQPFGGWETWVEFITRARMCA